VDGLAASAHLALSDAAPEFGFTTPVGDVAVTSKKKTASPTKRTKHTAAPTSPDPATRAALLYAADQTFSANELILQAGSCAVYFAFDALVLCQQVGTNCTSTARVPNAVTLRFAPNGQFQFLNGQSKVIAALPAKMPALPKDAGQAVGRLFETCLADVVTNTTLDLIWSPFDLTSVMASYAKAPLVMYSPYFFGRSSCRVFFDEGDLVTARWTGPTSWTQQWRSPSFGVGDLLYVTPVGNTFLLGPYNEINKTRNLEWYSYYLSGGKPAPLTLSVNPDTCVFTVVERSTKRVLATSGGIIALNNDTMPIVNVFPVYWGKQWMNATWVGDKIAAMKEFYSSLTGTTFISVLDQYMNGVKPSVTYVNHTIDPSPTPRINTQTLATIDLATASRVCELLDAGVIDTKGLPADTLYFPVYLDLNVSLLADFCAFHESVYCGPGNKAQYAPIKNGRLLRFGFFWNLDTFQYCQIDNTPAFGLRSEGAASLASVSAHELYESMTDPDPNYHLNHIDTAGNEMADLCVAVRGAWGVGCLELTRRVVRRCAWHTGAIELADKKPWVIQGMWDDDATTCTWGKGTAVWYVLNNAVYPTALTYSTTPSPSAAGTESG